MDAHDALQPWHTDRADRRASKRCKKSLTGRDRNLRRWTASLLAKLAEMTDAEYEALDLYPDE